MTDHVDFRNDNDPAIETAMRRINTATPAPDAAQIERVRMTLRDHIRDTTTVRRDRDAQRTRPGAVRSFIAQRHTALVASLAVAAGSVAIAVFAVDTSSRLDAALDNITVPSAAAAALNGATQRVNDSWAPLAAGEYYYVRKTESSDVVTVCSGSLTSSRCDHPLSTSRGESETWLAPNGSGRYLNVSNTKFTLSKEGANRADLRKDADYHIIEEQWYTPGGVGSARGGEWYGDTMRNFPQAVRKLRSAGLTTAVGAQKAHWGITWEQLETLSSDTRILTRQLVSLAHDEPGTSSTVQRLIDRRVAAYEDDVEAFKLAAQLLGSAPVSPDVRTALTKIVTSSAHSRDLGIGTDPEGRQARILEFTQQLDVRIPAKTAIPEQYPEDFSSFRPGVDSFDDVPRLVPAEGKEVRVPAYRVNRMVTIRFFIDEKSGLMLAISSTGRSSDPPRVQPQPGSYLIGGADGDTVITFTCMKATPRCSNGFTSSQRTPTPDDAQLPRKIEFEVITESPSFNQNAPLVPFSTIWLSQGRTTDTRSQIALCVSQPDVCDVTQLPKINRGMQVPRSGTRTSTTAPGSSVPLSAQHR